MTATTISVRLKQPVMNDLSSIEEEWQIDRSEVIRRLLIKAIQEWKIQTVLENIKLHKISVGKAAEVLNISLAEMLDKIQENNIDWTGYGQEDLEKDLEILK